MKKEAYRLHIEPCQPSDYQAVAKIYNEYIWKGGSTMDETLKTIEDIEGWIRKFDNREELNVLKKNGSVIGWGVIKKYSDREGYRFACETAVYLTESELRKGYGSMMKKHLFERCKALNYKHLVAKIFATNTASIQYNLKLGYEIVGTQRSIGFKNEQWTDIVIMQYIFE